MPTKVRSLYPSRRYARGSSGGDGGFESGWRIGSQIGKGIGGLAEAIQAAKQNQAAQALQARMDPVANQIINTAQPPRAALVAPGVNPQTNAPNVINPAIAGSPAAAGTEPATGGVPELEERARMAQLAGQLQAPDLARGRAARTLGGGVQPQAGSAGAWAGYQGGGTTGGATGARARGKAGQEEEPLMIGSEPVDNQGQLVKHFDGTYGSGSFGKVISNLDSAKVSDDGKYVLVGPEDKPMKIPIGDAKAYVKQQNVLRNKQGLQPFPVPGEDVSLGSVPDNPYPITNNLDAASVAPGAYVRTPDGQIKRKPTQ